MKLKEKIKNIKWLIENKKEIEKLIKRNKHPNDVAIGGIPSFQQEYVKEVLKEIENN